MGKKKRKHPHRHSGKLSPFRTKAQILTEVDDAMRTKERIPPPSLDKWKRVIEQIVEVELSFVETPADKAVYSDRVAELAEAMAWINLFQQRDLHDDNGNPIDVEHDDAQTMAFNAIHVGYTLGKAAARAAMEPHAVEGIKQSDRGKSQAEKNAQARRATAGPPVTRQQLLDLLKHHHRLHKCNQKELAAHVATELPIKKDRVRQLMLEYEIRKEHYEEK